MESTTRASVLTVEQCQCLLQVWNNITNALVFTGQATELSQALLHGARSVLNYDQATVNSARNRLAEVFAGASVAEIGQLQLSRLIAEISAALPSDDNSQMPSRFATGLELANHLGESGPDNWTRQD